MNGSETTLAKGNGTHPQDIMNDHVVIILEKIDHEVLFTSHGTRLLEMNTLIIEKKYEMTGTIAGKKCFLNLE